MGAVACGGDVRQPAMAAGETTRAAPEPAVVTPPNVDSLPPVLAVRPGSRGNPAAGRLIYGTYCVHCHGTHGAGDGRLARALSPPPADLRSLDLPGQVKQVFATLKAGVTPQHRAFMPGWGRLFRDQQLWDVIAYLPLLAEGR